MAMTTELFNAAERTMNACNLKPKDASAVLAKLEAQGVTASVAGGMLELRQGDTVFSTGVMLQAFATKNPRDFFGSAGEIRYKDDLQGDNQAKVRYIAEHGFDEWSRLPLNEKSAGSQHVITDQVPHAGMTRAQYQRLSLSEKTKLSGEIGPKGIEKILNRR